MQLVEQSKAKLDDAEWLYGICPELREKKVLVSATKLVDRKAEITLRKLLAHTAGFGYSFFNERLNEYGRPTGWDEFSGDAKDILEQPLVNQPGDRWEYGVNIDWAGQVVERVSGMTLDGYFQKNIFEPLGIKDMSCFPTRVMRENLVSMSQRDKDGSARDSDHLQRRAIFLADEPDVSKKVFNSGGAGLFGKPVEYCRKFFTGPQPSQSPSDCSDQANTTTYRNPNHTPQRRRLPDQPKADPPSRNHLTDVPKPDTRIPAVRPARSPSSEAHPHEPAPGPLPPARQPRPGLGSDVHADGRSRGQDTRRGYGVVGGPAEPVLVVRPGEGGRGDDCWTDPAARGYEYIGRLDSGRGGGV